MNRRVLIRYAFVGTLLRAGRPLTIGELRSSLLAARSVEEVVGPLTPKRMSDVLRAHVAQGRVQRVRRGVYAAVPSALSSTTRWRYRRWERYFDEYVLEVNRHGAPAPPGPD